MTKFSDKTTTKKGDVGESIVDEYIKSKGYIPYRPDADKAHPFDRLCAHPNKKTIFIAEVKAKAKRKYYFDTGINISHYNDYCNIRKKYNIKVFIFFVDEELKKMYGGFLSDLEKPHSIDYGFKIKNYPSREGGIIYFPMNFMRDISELTEQQTTELKELATKKEKYKQ